VVDGPTAADVHVMDGHSKAADSPEDGVRAADLQAVWCPASRVAGVPVAATVLALRASCVPGRAASSPAWDARRAVADARRCFRLAWLRVWALALPRALRRAQAGLGDCPAVVDDLVHATRVAASRRDNRRGFRATAGKTVFPSLFSL
jgi:hypothetical protein